MPVRSTMRLRRIEWRLGSCWVCSKPASPLPAIDRSAIEIFPKSLRSHECDPSLFERDVSTLTGLTNDEAGPHHLDASTRDEHQHFGTLRLLVDKERRGTFEDPDSGRRSSQ